MQLTTTDDKALTYIKAIVHGDSGIGKTSSLLTLFPKIKQTIIGIADRGPGRLKEKPFRCLRIQSWNDLRMAMGYFRNTEGIEDPSIKEAVSACTILGLDSLSAIKDYGIREIIEVDKRTLKAARASSTAEKVYERLLTREDYGLLRARMQDVLNVIVDLPIHVIVTSNSRWAENEKTGERKWVPDLNGQLAFDCGRYFDLVFHMESAEDDSGKNVRVWRTENDNNHLAKDGYGVLDPFERADWMTVFGKILGTHGSKT